MRRMLNDFELSLNFIRSTSSSTHCTEAVYILGKGISPVVLRWLWSFDYPTLEDVSSGYSHGDDSGIFYEIDFNHHHDHAAPPSKLARKAAAAARDHAATIIQKWIRGRGCRSVLRRALNMSWHSVKIQSWWRGCSSRWTREERDAARREREREGLAKIEVSLLLVFFFFFVGPGGIFLFFFLN
jgi:hypothetical protein